MRLGEPNWNTCIGVFEIELDKLTQISIPKEKAVEKLKNDIKKSGLKNPLEIRWTLDEEHLGQLRIFKGNQRIEALKKLGWQKAPCRITVEGYKDTEIIGEILKKFLIL